MITWGPDGGTGHPDHRLVSNIVTQLQRAGAPGVPERVFYMNLPDPDTGACPASMVPVYRVWNNRGDSNHRYMTDTSLRDQMVAKGYIAEGYGPDNVTMCGPM